MCYHYSRIQRPALLLFLLFAPLCFSIVPLTAAIPENVTVDDSLGDTSTGTYITYAPAELWKNGQNCLTCLATPNPDQMLFGTWHDGTFGNGGINALLNATLSFDGVAVYVFCAILPTEHDPIGNSFMRFFLDGELDATFVKAANGNATWEYNVPIYSKEGLPNGPHTITLANGDPDGPETLTILDYMIFTKDATTTTTSAATDNSDSAVAGNTAESLSPLGLTSKPTIPTISSVPPISSNSSQKRHRRTVIITIVVPVIVLLALVAIILAVVRRCKRARVRMAPTPWMTELIHTVDTTTDSVGFISKQTPTPISGVSNNVQRILHAHDEGAWNGQRNRRIQTEGRHEALRSPASAQQVIEINHGREEMESRLGSATTLFTLNHTKTPPPSYRETRNTLLPLRG